jgi:uncharacterized protein (DUF305 family)
MTTSKELKQPNKSQARAQQANQESPTQETQTTSSNSSIAPSPVDLVQAALDAANQQEAVQFAQMLAQHQTNQAAMADQIAGYLKQALNGQTLATQVLHRLEGQIERPQQMQLQTVEVEVPQLPDHLLFKQHYERRSIGRLSGAE